MKPLALLGMMLICMQVAVSQKASKAFHVGYFAPYVTFTGFSLGYAHGLKEWNSTSDDGETRIHQLQFVSTVGYFNQWSVADGILLNPEMMISRRMEKKRAYVSAHLGSGYMVSAQRLGSTIDLASGNAEYELDWVHQFVPNLGFGFGVEPKKTIGIFTKAQYGRLIGGDRPPAAYLALSIGLIASF
jgi:hypothetical protein